MSSMTLMWAPDPWPPLNVPRIVLRAWPVISQYTVVYIPPLGVPKKAWPDTQYYRPAPAMRMWHQRIREYYKETHVRPYPT